MDTSASMDWTLALGCSGRWSPSSLILLLKLFLQARKQTIYQDYIVAMVDGLGSIPINDSTYDVVMSRWAAPVSPFRKSSSIWFYQSLTTLSLASNGFAPGQIYPTAIPEILKVLRPGGYLLWTMREGYQQKSQRWSLLPVAVGRVADRGSVSGSPWWTRRSQTWQPLARQKWLLDQLSLTTLFLITLAGGKNL